MYGAPPDAPALWLGVATAVLYAGAMLGLSIYAFSRREFS